MSRDEENEYLSDGLAGELICVLARIRGLRVAARRARELAPEQADVLLGGSISAIQVGRIEEALALVRRATEQDPLSSVIYLRHGAICRLAGRLEESDRACRKALELLPQPIVAHMIMAMNLLARGRPDEALVEAGLEPAAYARGSPGFGRPEGLRERAGTTPIPRPGMTSWRMVPRWAGVRAEKKAVRWRWTFLSAALDAVSSRTQRPHS